MDPSVARPPMKRITAEDPESRSSDPVADNIAHLARLFPEAFNEGKVNFAVLRELLGDAVDETEEKYGLNWHGKRRARRLALTTSTGTLRPCPEESVEWDSTQNLMIEGDNLEVLKLLQKSYTNKVKLIYIDPPYNTGKDFVYRDNHKDGIRNYLKITGQLDGNGDKLCSNSDASGRFHTNWLNMMYPRLKVARTLLREDGVIFISLDDGEVDNARKMCSELFGEENFVTTVIWQKKYAPANDAKWLSDNHDYVLVVARSKELWRPTLLPRTNGANARYANPDNDPRGAWKPGGLDVKTYSEQYDYEIETPSGRIVKPPPGSCWRYSKERFKAMVEDDRIWFGKSGNNVPSIKRFLGEVKEGITPMTIWTYDQVGHNQEATQEVRELGVLGCDSPKPTRLLERIVQIGTDKDSIVLDFFAGSGTAGHAVMNLNASDEGRRRYIVVQLQEPLDATKSNQRVAAEFCEANGKPKSLSELTKERLRRAGGKVRSDNPSGASDVGFRVFKLDSSNIKAWELDRTDMAQSLLDHLDHIKPDRSEEDLFYELLLKLGFDLCVPVEQREIAGRRVNAVAGGVLVTCLAESIKGPEVDELALGIVSWRDEMDEAEDLTVVFRDSAFEDDVAKANMTEILRQYDVKDVRSL